MSYKVVDIPNGMVRGKHSELYQAVIELPEGKAIEAEISDSEVIPFCQNWPKTTIGKGDKRTLRRKKVEPNKYILWLEMVKRSK